MDVWLAYLYQISSIDVYFVEVIEASYEVPAIVLLHCQLKIQKLQFKNAIWWRKKANCFFYTETINRSS